MPCFLRPSARHSFLRWTFGAASAVALSALTVCCGPPLPPRETACAADEYEPNDDAASASELAPMQDDPNSMMDVVDSTFHTDRDEDWFRVRVRDTGLGGDPVITVTATSNVDVTAWFACNGERSEGLECSIGSETSARLDDARPFLRGCQGADTGPELDEDGREISGSGGRAVQLTTDCSGTTSDDGELYVRVAPLSALSDSSTCSYALRITVE